MVRAGTLQTRSWAKSILSRAQPSWLIAVISSLPVVNVTDVGTSAIAVGDGIVCQEIYVELMGIGPLDKNKMFSSKTRHLSASKLY